ncbi:MAG: cadherin-like domain-containing protein, partial [Hormoscilla sp.]
AGVGEENWISPEQRLPYTIRFENDAEKATAPAVFVTITQQLDSDLDWNSFEVGDFGFGDIYIEVPEGFQTYSERVDLRDTIGYFVDFNAAIDPDSGEATWTLETIEPETGEYPNDFDAGFLPPNREKPEGEGFVNYRIQTKTGITTDTVIDAEAEIVFDTNEPIDTPAIFHTIDITPPTSTVEELPETVSSPEFTVKWQGDDRGSGIATYDIYVSVEDGPFELWLDDTSETESTYRGEVGKTYGFYSVAIDRLGYKEEIPTLAQARTTMIEENVAPEPSDDAISTDADTPVTISSSELLANDQDEDVDTLSITSVSNAVNGTVELNAEGEIVFTPDAEFIGEASFSYTVRDSEGEENSATVTVIVNAVNAAPEPSDDEISTNADTPVTIESSQLLANDQDEDVDTLTITQVSNAVNGTVELNAEGEIVFTPDAEFTGEASFDYTVQDSEGEENSATVTVIVNAVNAAPQPEDDAIATNADTPVTISSSELLANDIDEDVDTLTITQVSNAVNGTVELNAEGEIVFTPDAEFTGEATFSYTVRDSEGEENSATVTVTVNAVNAAPEPEDDAISTNADTPVTIESSQLLANDQDEDVDTLTITQVSNAVNGTVELNAEGEILFTPDAEFVGEASFSYTVRDSEGEENSATVTVTVNAVNAAPEPEDDEISTNADTPVTIESSQLLANDQDEDLDTLTITQVSNAVNGTVELNAEGEIVFTPDAEFIGEASFDYTVRDSEGEENSATVTVTVNAVNAAPQPSDDEISTNADTPVTIESSQLLANDRDEDVDTLTITQVSNAVNGTVQLNAEGEILFTPDAEFIGEASFSYTVRDSEGEENSATVIVAVNPIAPGNEINGTPGRDNLTGTPSDDIITGFQGRDTLTGGAGSDRFVYSSILDAGDFITDFEIDSDKIVMTDLLSSLDYAGENPIADGYIQISSRGDSAMLSIDPDGALGGGRSRTFIMIEGTSADAMNENNNWLL